MKRPKKNKARKYTTHMTSSGGERSRRKPKMKRVKSVVCFPIAPDNTPLAYIYARQRQTLTKKQMQSIAQGLLSNPLCLDIRPSAFHCLVFAGDRFVVDRSAINMCRVLLLTDEEKQGFVFDICASIAGACRNSRPLRMFISKMSHDLGVSRSHDGSFRDCGDCESDGERKERCLTV